MSPNSCCISFFLSHSDAPPSHAPGQARPRASSGRWLDDLPLGFSISLFKLNSSDSGLGQSTPKERNSNDSERAADTLDQIGESLEPVEDGVSQVGDSMYQGGEGAFSVTDGVYQEGENMYQGSNGAYPVTDGVFSGGYGSYTSYYSGAAGNHPLAEGNCSGAKGYFLGGEGSYPVSNGNYPVGDSVDGAGESDCFNELIVHSPPIKGNVSLASRSSFTYDTYDDEDFSDAVVTYGYV